jgi:hypothetical protein
MRSVDAREVIQIPADQGTCPACGAGLFATIRTYFADTGEPIESGVHVGCVGCDVEIGEPMLKKVRQWVSSGHRVST